MEYGNSRLLGSKHPSEHVSVAQQRIERRSRGICAPPDDALAPPSFVLSSDRSIRYQLSAEEYSNHHLRLSKQVKHSDERPSLSVDATAFLTALSP